MTQGTDLGVDLCQAGGAGPVALSVLDFAVVTNEPLVVMCVCGHLLRTEEPSEIWSRR